MTATVIPLADSLSGRETSCVAMKSGSPGMDGPAAGEIVALAGPR